MPELSRAQLVVYAAIAVALLLLGARWLRSAQADDAQAGAFGGIEPAGSGGSFELDRGGGGVVIHVAGEVQEPGVYELAAGARVTDAVERAGGTTGAANVDAINLAAKLADGQQVVVPARVGTPGAAPAAAAEDGPISLGTATAEQLDTIEGIGPVTAEDIIGYRDEHGGLSSVDELDQISGIGPATMEALRDRLQP